MQEYFALPVDHTEIRQFINCFFFVTPKQKKEKFCIFFKGQKWSQNFDKEDDFLTAVYIYNKKRHI